MPLALASIWIKAKALKLTCIHQKKSHHAASIGILISTWDWHIIISVSSISQVPAAVMNVIEEKSLKDTRRVNLFYLLFCTSMYQTLTVWALFWVDIIPHFGFAHSLSDFGEKWVDHLMRAKPHSFWCDGTNFRHFPMKCHPLFVTARIWTNRKLHLLGNFNPLPVEYESGLTF